MYAIKCGLHPMRLRIGGVHRTSGRERSDIHHHDGRNYAEEGNDHQYFDESERMLSAEHHSLCGTATPGISGGRVPLTRDIVYAMPGLPSLSLSPCAPLPEPLALRLISIIVDCRWLVTLTVDGQAILIFRLTSRTVPRSSQPMGLHTSVLSVSSPPASPARLFYLDWLRVIAMGCIFLYHNQRVYDFGDWHIKNAVLSHPSTAYVEFFNVWMMPLFFVLASAAIYHSLRARTPGQFVKERFLRLAVPWLGLGMFVFGPVQVYVERLSHGDFSGTFVQFIPHYFDGFYGVNGNFAWMGLHLWFLMMLFLFIIITLPFLLPHGSEGRSLLSRLSPLFLRTPVLLLMFIPLALAAMLTNALGLRSCATSEAGIRSPTCCSLLTATCCTPTRVWRTRSCGFAVQLLCWRS